MNESVNKLAKRNIVLYLSITVILISLTFKISYAFFTAIITGNETAATNNVITGNLNIDFATSSYINNNKLFLIKDSERASKADSTVFTINNNNATGDVDGSYELYLTDLSISNNLKSADFKWELLINNEVKGSGNFLNATSGTDMKITSSVNNISYGQVDNCVFRIWLSETSSDQSSLIGTDTNNRNSFSAKIKLEAMAGK